MCRWRRGREWSGSGLISKLRPFLYFLPLFTKCVEVFQRVEKVSIELIAATNRASNAPQTACLVSDLGLEQAHREFFNSLFLFHALCE